MTAPVPTMLPKGAVSVSVFLERIRVAAAQCVLPLALLVILELLAVARIIDPRFVPTPRVVAGGFVELARSGEVWPHLRDTLLRIVQGYAIAGMLGVGIGLCLGYVRSARAYIMPVLEVLRPIPGVTLLPLTILWFGMGNKSQIPVIVFAAFFPTFVNTMHGVEEVPSILVRAARVMELRGATLFWKVMLPSSIPQVFTGLRLSVIYALTSCVGTEIIAGTDGLGFLILDYERTFVTEKMFAVMILIAVLGFCLNAGVMTAQRHFLRYRR